MTPKRVLIIAYFFPPIGGSGTQRPAKFVKYLTDFGWQPYVITTDRPYGDDSQGYDPTLLDDIPSDVQVWRVPTPQPQPVYRLARWLGWRSAALQMPESRKPPAPGQAVNAAHSPSWLNRIRRIFLAPLYLIHDPPVDPALYWSLRIAPLARRIIQQEQINVVLTTVPPWSALTAGRLLQKVTNRPWVADFRDPWTDNTFIYFPTPTRRYIDQWLEHDLIDHADAVISVTAPIVAGLQQKASAKATKKPFVLIPNGWDRDDFPDLAESQIGLPAPASVNGRIVLLHPGSAYQGEPLPLLAALDRLANDGVDLERLHFHFVGYMHPADRASILESPHSRLFQLNAARVPHDEALRLMRDAHILLLLLRKGPDASSGKIFEYMVAGRPVLAIGAKDGVAAQMVQSCRIGCAVDAENPDELARTLHRITADYSRFVAQTYHPEWGEIDRYERRTLTGKLAKTLEQVATK